MMEINDDAVRPVEPQEPGVVMIIKITVLAMIATPELGSEVSRSSRLGGSRSGGSRPGGSRPGG